MSTVRFTSVKEFLEELRAEADARHVVRNILRLTFRRVETKVPDIRHLYVMATATTDANSGKGSERLLLELYCGQLVEGSSSQPEIMAAAAGHMAELKEAARQLRLDVRGGVLE